MRVVWTDEDMTWDKRLEIHQSEGMWCCKEDLRMLLVLRSYAGGDRPNR